MKYKWSYVFVIVCVIVFFVFYYWYGDTLLKNKTQQSIYENPHREFMLYCKDKWGVIVFEKSIDTLFIMPRLYLEKRFDRNKIEQKAITWHWKDWQQAYCYMNWRAKVFESVRIWSNWMLYVDYEI